MSVRDRVLQAALECFTDEGYERTTITRIRERSGVSNGALFHHFPTKEAIAGALYLDSMASIQEGYRQVLAQDPTSLAEVVEGVIRQQLSWIAANPDRARFLYSRGRLDWSTEIGARLRAMNENVGTEYRKWLAPFISRGEVRDLPLALIVAIVNGPAHSIAQQWLAGQLSDSILDYIEPLTGAAVAGLGGTTAPSGHPGRILAGRVRIQMLGPDGEVIAEGEVDPRPGPPADRTPD